MNTKIGERVVEFSEQDVVLTFTGSDIMQFVEDCNSYDGFQDLLEGFCRAIRFWEESGKDWPAMYRKVYGQLLDEDKETLTTVISEIHKEQEDDRSLAGN